MESARSRTTTSTSTSPPTLKTLNRGQFFDNDSKVFKVKWGLVEEQAVVITYIKQMPSAFKLASYLGHNLIYPTLTTTHRKHRSQRGVHDR
jgi:hypothetical protein